MSDIVPPFETEIVALAVGVFLGSWFGGMVGVVFVGLCLLGSYAIAAGRAMERRESDGGDAS